MYSFISSTQNDHQGNMNHMNPNRRFTQHNSSPDSPNTNDPKGLKQKNSNSFLMELVNASTSLGANTANLLNATGTNGALILPTMSTIASTLPTHSSSLYSHNNSLTAPMLTLGANSTCSSMSISTTSPSSLSCLPKYRNLGRSGLRVSQFGFGTWVTFGSQVTDDVAEDMITLAYQSGINLFDTAEVYASGKAESTLGRILKKKQWRRSSYIVCTKIYWGGKSETEKGLSRKHIIEGLNASLERLQLDYVDVVFASKPDPHTPMEEIVRAFTHVINNNMAFYWGTSRWNAMEIMEAYSVARQFNLIPPICEQSEYHMFQREDVEVNLPEVHSKIGIGTMTYGSLACGMLTGKYDDGIPIHSRASLKGYGWLKEKILSDDGRKQQVKIRELQLIADKISCTLAQLSLAWCVKNDSVHCILLGASSVDQLYENIQSLQVVQKLTPSIISEIERIIGNKPVARQLSKSENLTK